MSSKLREIEFESLQKVKKIENDKILLSLINAEVSLSNPYIRL